MALVNYACIKNILKTMKELRRSVHGYMANNRLEIKVNKLQIILLQFITLQSLTHQVGY